MTIVNGPEMTYNAMLSIPNGLTWEMALKLDPFDFPYKHCSTKICKRRRASKFGWEILKTILFPLMYCFLNFVLMRSSTVSKNSGPIWATHSWNFFTFHLKFKSLIKQKSVASYCMKCGVQNTTFTSLLIPITSPTTVAQSLLTIHPLFLMY